MDAIERFQRLRDRADRAGVISDKIQRLTACKSLSDVPADLSFDMFNAGKDAITSKLTGQLEALVSVEPDVVPQPVEGQGDDSGK